MGCCTSSIPFTDEYGMRLHCRCKQAIPKEVTRRYKDCAHLVWNEVRRTKRRFRGKKRAVIFDIDDTCLWDSCPTCEDQDERIYTYSPRPVLPMLQLFRALLREGILICFVSARKQTSFSATESQLASAGYHGYSDLELLPPQLSDIGVWGTDRDMVAFKQSARRAFVQRRNVHVIATVGDQLWDCEGPEDITGLRVLVRDRSDQLPGEAQQAPDVATTPLNMPRPSNAVPATGPTPSSSVTQSTAPWYLSSGSSPFPVRAPSMGGTALGTGPVPVAQPNPQANSQRQRPLEVSNAPMVRPLLPPVRWPVAASPSPARPASTGPLTMATLPPIRLPLPRSAQSQRAMSTAGDQWSSVFPVRTPSGESSTTERIVP